MGDNDDVPQLLEISAEETPGRAQPEFDAGGRRLNRSKVPLTLLTGYLGAGKSTLLDYILTAEHGYRIAVCMNDFGDTTDIEAKSLQMSNPNDPNAPSNNMLSLPNGCLCCSFKDMGIAAIEEMVAAQRENIDWVVVELTGLADPAPIAKDFWTNEEMGDLVLDSVICVVDSRNILKQLSEERADGPNEAQKQVACADVILLNKTDLVTPPELDAVAAAVRDINPTLRVHRTVKGNVSLDALFNLRAFTSPTVAGLEDAAPCCSDPHTHDHDHKHSSHATGPNAIATAVVPLPPALDDAQFARLTTAVEDLLWRRTWPGDIPPEGETVKPDVLRTKGYVVLWDGSGRLIQGVDDLFEVREMPPGEHPEPKVVFIGRGVDARLAQLVAQFVGI